MELLFETFLILLMVITSGYFLNEVVSETIPLVKQGMKALTQERMNYLFDTIGYAQLFKVIVLIKVPKGLVNLQTNGTHAVFFVNNSRFITVFPFDFSYVNLTFNYNDECIMINGTTSPLLLQEVKCS
ncbi:hypothetical protein B9Q10_01675 [Candidatus Marsarchaeota G2 archaeon ECH_B_SAG-E12]|uniref:Uncharacterized protein n=4 Tax=Candidatus Marsarchaeota TaxID=1978152 RepID=A0A2R6BU34_9ARCH|nr:MAG: hypothetical protein B9Q10_01675 [Candidatus Marsarchaeota G2 archaeon ECH_B_SAG-E12]